MGTIPFDVTQCVNPPHQLPLYAVLQGRYELRQVLGQGGFGITYRAFDRLLQEEVAVKEFYPNTVVNRNCNDGFDVRCISQSMEATYAHNRKRFIREATALSRFRHLSAVVEIKGYFEENNTAYIVMEYIPGQTLANYVANAGGRLSFEETMRILEPVMSALRVIHEGGMIHRDISPDNIILHPEKGAMLLDFGAVREIKDPGEETQKLSSTAAVVKHGFAPPEQYYSGVLLDARTDEYALCATIYYCLTGKLPEPAPALLADAGKDIWGAVPGLDEGKKTALRKGMALRREERYPDIGTLTLELSKQTTGGTMKKAIIIAAALVAVVLVFVLGRASAPKEVPPETTTAMQQTQPRQTIPASRPTTPPATSRPTTPPATTAPAAPQHEHSWVYADYNHPQYCLSCGATQGSPKPATSPLYLRDIVYAAGASSVYSGDTLGKHSADNLYDGRLDTNWTEDSPGSGKGEYVFFDLNGVYAINKMSIYIGSHFNEGIFSQNCRPKTITVYFNDNEYERIDLSDIYEEQVITFSRFYYTEYIKIVIEDVYLGSKYMDAIIAEVDFTAYRP